jgi:hypothetical protein
MRSVCCMLVRLVSKERRRVVLPRAFCFTSLNQVSLRSLGTPTVSGLLYQAHMIDGYEAFVSTRSGRET